MALRSSRQAHSGQNGLTAYEAAEASRAQGGGHGGLLATIFSAVALAISGLSYYETSLKSADLAVYVPPMIHYARDGSDVFNIPITVANDGAKTGTVLAMELQVDNLRAGAERPSARFHGAFLGDYPRDDKVPPRSFAPLSVAGHGTVTETVRFYHMGEPDPILVDDKGDFRFTLKIVTANPADAPPPLVFERHLAYLAVQHLAFRNGTIGMTDKNWKPAVSSGSAAAGEAAPASKP